MDLREGICWVGILLSRLVGLGWSWVLLGGRRAGGPAATIVRDSNLERARGVADYAFWEGGRVARHARGTGGTMLTTERSTL